MNKNLKAILWIAAIGAGGYYGYKKLILTKDHWMKQILIVGGASSAKVLATFEDKYVEAWGKAAKKGQPQFIYNGAKYATIGGKKIKRIRYKTRPGGGMVDTQHLKCCDPKGRVGSSPTSGT